MNFLFALIFYLSGIFLTLCGILLNIYFRPSEKEKYGYEYPDVPILLMIWPITIIITIIVLFFKYIIFADYLVNYVGKKGESRQTKKRLTRNINESGFYGSENSK